MLGARPREVTFAATFGAVADGDARAQPEQERGDRDEGDEEARHVS